MMKQHWYDKGFAARLEGRFKLASWDKGAKHFNEGWEEAERQQRWGEEREEHNELAGELEDLKNRICNYGDDLDLDSLTELLYEMGARA
tara:strand:- start:81 stop:347 length:267 start_codon:yes stop_codon:yes gene_type:complete